MKTAIPGILKELGESEYTVLSAAYCKMLELKELLDGMHEGYMTTGTAPSLAKVDAARMVLNEMFGSVEEYVLALADPGDPVCPL